jgi:polyisoprenoid-binding protein YceI
MKKIYALIALLIIAGAGYWLYDYYAGNHIQVKEVIQNSAGSDQTGQKLTAKELNKKWEISDGSKVYFNVKTSKEAVNFLLSKVTGNWQINLNQPEKMSAQAEAEINSLDSGNPSRDNDIKGSFSLNADSFPKAKFDLKSVEQWPAKWVEGQAVPFKMNGQLTVKGISKDVQFDSEAQYVKGQLKLKGKTVVTFQDFGMRNPHTLVLDTENNVNVILQLDFQESLSKEGK